MSLRVPIAAATMSFGVLAEAVRELLQAEFEHGVGRGLWEGDKRETALVKCVVNISVKMGLILKATDFGIRYILGTWDFLHSQGILGYKLSKLDGIYPHTATISKGFNTEISLDHKLTSIKHCDKTIPASAMATGCESHRMAVC